MSNPWDGMSDKPLSQDELKRWRYSQQFFEQNDTVIRRTVQALKAWWLLPLGVALAVSGALGGIVEIITNKAGL